MASLSAAPRTFTHRTTMVERLKEIAAHRELLLNLVRLELKAKYKASALGFAWSLLNPAMYLVVFYVAFNIILRAGIPRYPIYLLSGLLVWNFFTTALLAGTGSIVSNAGLVRKVWFPREVLALSAIGAALVHFFLQSLVLVAALVVFRHPVDFAFVALLPLALLAVLLLVSGMALLLSALNVYLRDIQHFLELAIMAWFWMTPIIYSYTLITSHFAGGNFPALLNPITPIVLTFQRALYGGYGGDTVVPLDPGVMWHLRNLAVVTVVATVLLVVALQVFRRLEGNLAEEL